LLRIDVNPICEVSLLPLLLILFIAVPLVEIYILIQVGHSVGALSTILLCVLTAAIGAGLIRLQGLTTLMRARRTMDQGMAPAMEMLEGVALAAAGLMLLTPGFRHRRDRLSVAAAAPATTGHSPGLVANECAVPPDRTAAEFIPQGSSQGY
jgi:hypothetical protein